MVVVGQAGSVVLHDEVLTTDNTTIGRDIETDAVVHKEKDFISLLSCTPSECSSNK